MNLTYNGVKLQICHFNAFRQRAVASDDGADYLFTHFFMDVSCVWNQWATASFNRVNQIPPGDLLGDPPATSIAALRDTLMQKRRQLIVDIGGDVILLAPQKFLLAGIAEVDASTDANNGPNPLHCDVVNFWGVSTAIVHFVIECWINETNRFSNVDVPLSAIISNRWEQSEDIDKTFRSTLYLDGQVVFRPDIIALGLHRPDTTRTLFIPPCQLGYQRKGVQVRASSDGLRISYSCRDEQAEGGYQMLPYSPIVEASGRTWYDLDWLGEDGRLPVMQIGAEVEVWGRNSTSRTQLANAVVRALASVPGSLGAAVQSGVQATLHQYLSVDFPHRHASGSVVFALNGLYGSGRILVGGADALIKVQNAPLFTDFSAVGLWAQGGLPGVNIGPPNVGTRSEAGIALVTQALMLPGAAPTNVQVEMRIF